MFAIEDELDHRGKEIEKERALKLAKFYKEEGLYEDAIKNYELYIFLSNQDAVEYTIFKDLAICYSLNGLTAEAINNLKKALKCKSDDISVMYLLAQMFEQSGMYDEAVFYYNEIIKKDPKMSSVYYQLGEIAYKRGNVDTAIENWTKVVEIEPTNSYAHYLLGSLFFYKKNYAQAEENFKAAVKNGFKSSQLYNYLGKIYAKSGETEKARINFLIAMERDKVNNSIYEGYLSLLTDEELVNEEIKLHNLEEDDIISQYRLGLLYKHKGEFEKTEAVFKDILNNPKLDDNLKIKVELIMQDLKERLKK